MTASAGPTRRPRAEGPVRHTRGLGEFRQVDFTVGHLHGRSWELLEKVGGSGATGEPARVAGPRTRGTMAHHDGVRSPSLHARHPFFFSC